MDVASKIPFAVGETNYLLRVFETRDAQAFQRIYESLKECGQHYAYLSKFETDENGEISYDKVGDRFVANALKDHKKVPRLVHRFVVSDTNDHTIGYAVVLLEFDQEWEAELKSGCEIGYFISPEHQGKGIATQAIAVLVEEVSKVEPITSFWGMAHPDNVASIKIFNKLGMRFLRKTISREDKQSPERVLYLKDIQLKSAM